MANPNWLLDIAKTAPASSGKKESGGGNKSGGNDSKKGKAGGGGGDPLAYLPGNFEERAQLIGMQFNEFRNRGMNPRWTPSDIHNYRAEWLARKLPRESQPLMWGGPGERHSWQQEKYWLPPNASVPDLDFAWSASDPRLETAKKRYREAKDYFGSSGQNFEFQKVLGFGGLGLALQYRYKGVTPHQDIAVKLSLRGWEADDIRWESRATRAMKGAAHCIQLIDPTDVGLPEEEKFVPEPDQADSSEEEESSGDESMDEGQAPPPRRPRRNQTVQELLVKARRVEDRKLDAHVGLLSIGGRPIQDRKDYMFLEFVEGGNLQNLIRRIQDRERNTRQRVFIPNKVLWGLWLCLVRACVAMKYPPRKFHPQRRTRYRPDGRTDLIERIPAPGKRWRAKNWVHFDIDPSNIFIGNLEKPPAPDDLLGLGKRKRLDDVQPDRLPDEHRYIPRLKLADFGLAEEIKSHKRNIYYQMRRKTGKVTYFAPEQFAADWDLLPGSEHGPEVGENEVAGNYGSAMNVYQVALTMWVLITRMQPPVPPVPQPPEEMHIKKHQIREMPDFVEDVANPFDPNVHISYCPLLMAEEENIYEYIDVDLRRTIFRCMYHRPGDRPSVETLLEQAEEGVQKEWPDEENVEIELWVRDFLFNGEVY